MIESLETINYRLKRDYGYFDGKLEPNWRIVWSHDQIEKRWVTHTPEGLELLEPIVKEVPKYRQWADNCYILERAIPIPEFVETDLVGKWSYEPVWSFVDKNGNALPPRWEAIKLIIDAVYKAAAGSVGAKYKDPDIVNPKDAKEAQLAKIEEMRQQLFGNETSVGDALAYGSGVTVPHKQFEEKSNVITRVDE